MRWLLVVILLVSLGLNGGLAWRLARLETPPGPAERTERTSHRHALRDSTRWRGYLQRRLDWMRRELDLDEAQVEALHTLHEGAHGVGRRFRGIESGRQELFARIARGEFDPDSVRITLADLSRRQAAVDSLVVEKMLQEMAILTPQQRPRYLQMLPPERFGGHSGAGHRRPGEKDDHGPRRGHRGGG